MVAADGHTYEREVSFSRVDIAPTSRDGFFFQTGDRAVAVEQGPLPDDWAAADEQAVDAESPAEIDDRRVERQARQAMTRGLRHFRSFPCFLRVGCVARVSHCIQCNI